MDNTQVNSNPLQVFLRQIQEQAAQSHLAETALSTRSYTPDVNSILLPPAPMFQMQMPGTFPGFSLGTPPPALGALFGGPLAQVATMALGGTISNFVADSGRFLPGPVFGRSNLLDHIKNRAVSQAITQAMNLSSAPDTISTARFLSNLAISAKGTTDPDEIASLQLTAGKAAQNMMRVMSPFVPMLAASPQLRQMSDAIGLTRLLGTQIAAAKISMVERGPFTPFGADPKGIADIATGIADYFAPGGTENLLRSRGFNVAEVGDLYAGLATRSLIATPFGIRGGAAASGSDIPGPTKLEEDIVNQGGRLAAGVRQGKSEDINRKLESYTRAVELVAQVMGPNAPMEKLLQGLEKITGGGLSQLDPSRLERQILTFQETAKFANIDTGLLMGITQQASVTAAQLGVNATIGAPIGGLAVRIDAADRQIRRMAGGGPEFGRPNEGQRISSLAQAAIGGAASTVGTTAAGLQALAKRLGDGNLEKGKRMLPAHLQQVLDDFHSSDPRKQARAADALSSPSLLINEAATSLGIDTHVLTEAMRNQNFYGPEQDERFSADMLRLQAVREMESATIGLQTSVPSLLDKFGIQLGKDETSMEFAQSLTGAFFGAGTQAKGIEAIQDILVKRGTRNTDAAGASAAIFGAAVGQIVNRRDKGAETRIRELVHSGSLEAEKRFQASKVVRAAYNEVIYGKTSPGSFGGYINNLIRYVQTADPGTLNAGDIARIALGGVPTNIAISSQIQGLARKYGISTTTKDGKERQPASVVAELGSKIITAANNADPETRKTMLKDYNVLLGAGEGTGFAAVLDIAEQSALAEISNNEALTLEEKESMAGEQTRIFQHLRSQAGIETTAEVSAEVYTRKAGKLLDKTEQGAKILLGAEDITLAQAGKNAGQALRSTTSKIFSDLKAGKLRPELETSLSEMRKKELRGMAKSFRKAIQRADTFGGADEDTALDAASKEELQIDIERIKQASTALYITDEKYRDKEGIIESDKYTRQLPDKLEEKTGKARKFLETEDLTIAQAGGEVGNILEEESSKIFSDLATGRLRPELEATLSEEQKEKLKRLAPEFRKATLRLRRAALTRDSIGLSDARRKRVEKQFEIVDKAKEVIQTYKPISGYAEREVENIVEQNKTTREYLEREDVTLAQAGEKVSSTLEEEAGKLFSDLGAKKLRPELEATLSEEQKEKLKRLAPEFKKSIQKVKRVSKSKDDIGLSKARRRRLVEELDISEKAEKILGLEGVGKIKESEGEKITAAASGEKTTTDIDKEIVKEQNKKIEDKKVADAREHRREEKGEPSKEGPTGSSSDPIYVVNKKQQEEVAVSALGATLWSWFT